MFGYQLGDQRLPNNGLVIDTMWILTDVRKKTILLKTWHHWYVVCLNHMSAVSQSVVLRFFCNWGFIFVKIVSKVCKTSSVDD